ncbi:MAG: hypothetical protein HOP04_02305 [Methylophilaceae bacterium]|nr:hypothetical protein [Methylophilaceae bacterium]
MSQQAIRKACKDNGGKFRNGIFTYQQGKGNGGTQYRILLTSLPEAAQANYWIDQKKSIKSNLSDVIKPQEPATIDDSIYQGMADEYSRKPGSIKDEAQRRLSIVTDYKALIEAGFKVKSALFQLQQRVSKPTLYRWLNKIGNAPRTHWETLLAPDHEGRAKDDIHIDAWFFFQSRYGQQSKPDATVIYRLMLKEANAKGWGALPCCKTFERRWEREVPENLKILLREGETKLKESTPHQKRDYKSLKIHEGWESDGHVVDVFCRWPDRTVARPWIVLIRDIRTRMPLAFKVYHTTNAELVMETFKRACERTGTTPENFTLDNGTEYSNIAFTGGQKSTVRHSVVKGQPVGALTRMGIAVRWATPYHGAAKPIESFWNVIIDNMHKLSGRSYTGRNPVERPENCSEEHALPIEEYVQRLNDTLGEFSRGELGKHRGNGMEEKCPMALYEALMKEHVLRPASVEHLRAMRHRIFSRTLSQQRVFEVTIPGYGKVFYEPDEANEEVKRGFTYDILPDISDPNAPALIYEGARYLGDAMHKACIQFYNENAAAETNKRRSKVIKQTKAQAWELTQQAAGNPAQLEAPNRGMPDLLASAVNMGLKLLPESPSTPVSRYEEQDNGDILDKQSGVITKRKPAPTRFEEENTQENNELERKRKEKEDAELRRFIEKTQQGEGHSGCNLNAPRTVRI